MKDSATRAARAIAAGMFALGLVGCSGESDDSSVSGDYEQTSDHGVSILTPVDALDPTGTWNGGTRAGDYVHVAGMRGIDPATNELLEGDLERLRQGFLTMQTIAASEGAALQDAARLVDYVTDMIVEVSALNDDDIFEVEGTFYAPAGQGG